MKMLLLLFLSVFTPSPHVAQEVETIVDRLCAIQEAFNPTPQGFRSCLALAARTDIPFDVCVRILERESAGGERGAMRLCRKWGKGKNGRWGCPGGYYSVHKTGWALSDRTIEAEACEVSEWQLRHSPSWSWIREHNRQTGADYAVLDMEDFGKSLDVMETAYSTLKQRAATEGPRCIETKTVCKVEGLLGAECLQEGKVCTKRCRVIPGSEDMVWLQYWNGCRSYRSHTKAVLSYREKNR